MTRLGDRFARQAPAPPDPAGWALRARTRYRRRNLVGLAVAVLVLGIPAGWVLMRDPGVGGQPVASSAPVPPAPDRVELCAPYQDTKRSGDPALWLKVNELPRGAVRVWLCDDRVLPNPTQLMPSVPLTDPDAVQRAIRAYNALPREEAEVCTSDFGTSYYAVYEYPNGVRIPVKGILYGCRTASTGPDTDRHHRAGSKRLLDELFALWPKGSVPAAGCPTATVEPAGRDRLTLAAACLPGQDRRKDATALSADALEALRKLTPQPDEARFGPPVLKIALIDEANNVTLWDYDGARLRDGQGLLASPGEGLVRELADAEQLLTA
ncbi:MAG: hypothetical protein Q3997_01240 [Propionibacteriaceae bacterium]|nr:hypothetical protein [Propionibacteriaceae bacterium]